MLYRILIPTLLLFSAAALFAQKPTPSPTPSKEDEKLRKEAVEYLRQTVVDVNAMTSLENRLSFGAELASLMWYYDPKESRQMYLGVTSDFRQLLINFDMQLNTTTIPVDDDSYSGGMFADVSDRMKLDRKIQTALGLRKQLALSLAEHEPDLALSFYNDSASGLANPLLVERMSANDSYFEFQLMSTVAENDAGRAVEFGKKSLGKGVTFQHIELLKKIYASDQDKAISFASAIASQIKSEKSSSIEPYIVGQLLDFGDKTLTDSKKDSKQKPIYSESELRDLVDSFVQMILSSDNIAYSFSSMSLIEKYSPSRAAQLKVRQNKMSSNSMNMVSNMSLAMNTSARYSNSNANVALAAANDAQKVAEAAEAREAAEKKLMDDVQNLGTKPLSKEERGKVVAELRTIIVKKRNKNERIVALSLLAAQVAKAGDRELAAIVMKEAENAIPSQPKNYEDYMLTWMVASGYADVNTDRSFTLLSDTILRLNDTIAAFVKVAEFIDTRGEIIDDGNIQVGQFGGSMLRDLTRGLSISEPTLRTLAKADFAKLKGLADSFDRQEVRILAKMLVLRAVLNNKPSNAEKLTENLIY